jgi:SAM-dependent methyltransferase
METPKPLAFTWTDSLSRISFGEEPTMNETSIYIHGTEPTEQERLAALNHLTNRAFIEFLNVQSGMRILEVGSGLGLLTAAVAQTAADVDVVGIEQSPVQIANAVENPHVRYVQGDAHHLQFDDGIFDLVYTRYVLEHVADPETVLKEMRRVTRHGGRVAACENDITLVRVDPRCPVFEMVWEAFQRHQCNLGGDSHIGRSLYRLFRKSGLSNVELSVQPEVHWYGSVGFAGWIENLIGNIESGRPGLIHSGVCSKERIDAAVAELTALLNNDQASSQFIWNRAVATR